MSKIAGLAGFLLRLLAAVCAAPLIVGWQVGVAYLEAHVLPSTVVFIVLTVLGIGVAVLLGLMFTMHADPELTAFDRPGLAEGANLVAGFTTAFAIIVSLTVASTWAFGSIAEQRTCTVAETGAEEHMHGQGGSVSIPFVRLECTDGREDTIGGNSTLTTHNSWRSWHEGDRVRVAYDPAGHLSSRAVEDLQTPIRNWLFGISTGITMLLHIIIVITLAHRRWRTS